MGNWRWSIRRQGTGGTPRPCITTPGDFPNRVRGFAYDAGGTLYLSTGGNNNGLNTCAGCIFTVDLATGQATPVIADVTGWGGGVTDLAFAQDGTLYAMTTWDALYSIDIGGGTATPVYTPWASGNAANGGFGLAYGTDQTLYLSTENLYAIDTGTPGETDLGAFTYTGWDPGVLSNLDEHVLSLHLQDKTLLGVMVDNFGQNASAYLVEVDPATSVATHRADLQRDLRGMTDLSEATFPPGAYAGSDQILLIGSSVTIDGSSTDNDSTPGNQWVFNTSTCTTDPTLSGSTTTTPAFTADQKGNCTLTLTVTDGGGLESIDSVSISTTPWEAQPHPTTTTHDSALAVVNGKVYTFGRAGLSNGDKVFEYDIASGTWTNCGGACAVMGSSRYRASATAVGGKIYVIGGYDFGTSAASTLVEEFDPSTNTWTNCGGTCTAMGSAVYWHEAVAVGGSIFVLGGTTNATTGVQTVREFNVGSNTWDNCGGTCANLPAGRFLFGAAAATVAAEDRIFVFGGFNPVTTVYEYDVATNTWTNCGASCTSLPEKRGRLSAQTINNKILIFGGTDDFPNFNYWTVVREYDPGTNTYTDCTGGCGPMLRGYESARGATDGTNVFLTLYNTGGSSFVQYHSDLDVNP